MCSRARALDRQQRKVTLQFPTSAPCASTSMGKNAPSTAWSVSTLCITLNRRLPRNTSTKLLRSTETYLARCQWTKGTQHGHQLYLGHVGFASDQDRIALCRGSPVLVLFGSRMQRALWSEHEAPECDADCAVQHWELYSISAGDHEVQQQNTKQEGHAGHGRRGVVEPWVRTSAVQVALKGAPAVWEDAEVSAR